jgi:diguanylate cyclase (GGDEF)-like protein
MTFRFEHRLLVLLFERARRRGESLHWMQRRDPTTGLLRRDAFIDEVRADRTRGVNGTLAVCDIDHFKLINDRYGHSVGDLLLVEVASRLRASIPDTARIARYSGDEFCWFLPGGLETGRGVAEACLTSARHPIHLPDGVQIDLTLSIGLAPLPISVEFQRGLASADAALYAAKTGGRDRAQVFTEETQGIIGARRELAASVASLQERNLALQNLVQTDALTGLRNRRALDQVLGVTCGSGDGIWPRCAVAFLDIDHFGDYNHVHGDSQGDEVLRRVAQAVRDSARKDDLVFRKGGEEILVVLPHATETEAKSMAERIRRAVESLAIKHDNSAVASVVTVTIGVATAVEGETVTVDELMQRASDAAMKAKVRNQRNAVHAV